MRRNKKTQSPWLVSVSFFVRKTGAMGYCLADSGLICQNLMFKKFCGLEIKVVSNNNFEN